MTTHSGESLLEWLQHQAPLALSIWESACLIRQAADALQDLHTRGRMHGHVTPASFLMHPNAVYPNLPELQLVRNEHSTSREAAGNALYIAPEQWDGRLVPATDQYALGIIAYQLLTWRSPFQGTQQQLSYQHVHVPPQPPSAFNARIPPEVDSVILRALSKKPEDRFPSSAAFANAFMQAAQLTASPSNASLSSTQASHEAPLTASEGTNNRAMSEMTNSKRSSNEASLDMKAPSSPVRELLVLGLAFLLVVGSIGWGFYGVVKRNQSALTVLQATVNATATSTARSASRAATITAGTPLLADALTSNTNGRWTEGATCVFKDGTYHVLVLNKPGWAELCGLRETAFANVAMQVDVALLAGSDTGFIFRYNQRNWYGFEITRDGAFALLRFDAAAGGTVLIPLTKSNAIAAGSRNNTLLVIADGPDIGLYINRVLVGAAHDSTYASGGIGFIAGTSRSEAQADASFSHFKVFGL